MKLVVKTICQDYLLGCRYHNNIADQSVSTEAVKATTEKVEVATKRKGTSKVLTFD